MKNKILVFALAFAMLFTTMAIPTTAYAFSEEDTFVIQGVSYDFSQHDGLNEMLKDVENPLMFMIPRGYVGNVLTHLMNTSVFVADGDIIKNLVIIFNGESNSTTWSQDTSGKYYVEFSVRPEYKNGGFESVDVDGIYQMDYQTTKTGDFSTTGILSDMYTSSYFNFYPEQVCAFYGVEFDSSKSPSHYLKMFIDGDITVTGADYIDGQYVHNSVFMKALHRTPLANVMKGVKASPLEQIVKLLPMAIVCLVGYVALRKGLAILQAILRQA